MKQLLFFILALLIVACEKPILDDEDITERKRLTLSCT